MPGVREEALREAGEEECQNPMAGAPEEGFPIIGIGTSGGGVVAFEVIHGMDQSGRCTMWLNARRILGEVGQTCLILLIH